MPGMVARFHGDIRTDRKTHVADLASGDRKSDYVVLSNTLIGVLLFVMGGLKSAFLGFGLEVGIDALSVLSILGALVALTMKHVQD